MIIITCPECESTKVIVDEVEIKKDGNSWFKCKGCKHQFTLELASYRKENDLFD